MIKRGHDPFEVEALGGVSGSLTKQTDVLVIGEYATDSWRQSSYGAKIEKAERSFRRALELDPGIGEAHASLGLIAQNEFRWKSSEKELRRAIELNPNYATAHLWYSLVLQFTGRFEDGLREVRTAAVLDPLSPIISANLARCLLQLGDYPGAIAEARKALEP